MSKLKSYEVIVKTSAEWSGTVQAKSRSDARRIAGQEFDEGSLQQCGEEVETVIAFKPRTRRGSWRATRTPNIRLMDGGCAHLALRNSAECRPASRLDYRRLRRTALCQSRLSLREPHRLRALRSTVD
jgi:hypothetical protein